MHTKDACGAATAVATARDWLVSVLVTEECGIVVSCMLSISPSLQLSTRSSSSSSSCSCKAY